MRDVDVVIVSYNSATKLRRCLAGLIGVDGINVVVVDNDSQDGSAALLRALPVTTIALDWNSGFSHGCNVGWRAGSAEYVLFLNPDAAIDVEGVFGLATVLDRDRDTGIVAPRIVHESGELAHSLRRFPSLARTLAQACFLHRLAPNAAWADEVVRSPAAYGRVSSPDWVSGACLMVRRRILEELDGFDERFFLYSEDVDLCKRVRETGAKVVYEPGVTALHVGGASAPADSALPLMAASRRIYAHKHERPLVAALYGFAVTISSLTHAAVSTNRTRRRGHLRALAPRAVRPKPSTAPPRGVAH